MTAKVKLGFTAFRERPTKENPHTVEQAAIVVAKNLDGTARLHVWSPTGDQFIIDRAELVQKCGDVECHYRECCSSEEAPPKLKAGGGAAAIVERTILYFDNDVQEADQLVGWQQVFIIVPDGSTFDDFNANGCYVSMVDNPRFTGAGVTKPVSPPMLPLLGPFNAISGATVPWWWTAGLAILPPARPITIYNSTTGTSQPYYY